MDFSSPLGEKKLHRMTELVARKLHLMTGSGLAFSSDASFVLP